MSPTKNRGITLTTYRSDARCLYNWMTLVLLVINLLLIHTTHMPSHSRIILIYSLIACVLLYITENIYHPVYSIQMLQKVVSFLIIPLILGYVWKQRVGRAGKMSRISVIYGVSLGLLSMVIIGVTYSLLRDMIDWTAIRESMEARHIDETTFVFVFAYIMFGNSWIEEYFFR